VSTPAAMLDFAAVDLDGTILDSDGVVSPRMRLGLEVLRQHGLRLIVVTGRSPYSVTKLGLGTDLFSLFEPVMALRDGDIIWDRAAGAVMHARYLTGPVAPKMLADLPDVVCEYVDATVATSRAAALRYSLFYGFPRSAITIEPHPPATSVLKIVAFHDFRGQRANRLDLAGTSHHLSPAADRLVVTPPGSCKAAGLDYVLRHCRGRGGFDQVMAIGDGPNDECLLGVVPHGIAVANAEPAAAARAALTLRVPLADYLAGFTGPVAGRRPDRCPHIAQWTETSCRP